MNMEEMTRYFLAEAGKSLDFEENPELEWRGDEGASQEVRARVISTVSLEFVWFVRYDPRVPAKTHVGLIYEDNECVFRLDTNDSHRNPREAVRHGTHLHRAYTMAHQTSIADFIDGVPDAPWQAVNWFLRRANIVEIPPEWWSDLPTVVPAGTLFGGR